MLTCMHMRARTFLHIPLSCMYPAAVLVRKVFSKISVEALCQSTIAKVSIMAGSSNTGTSSGTMWSMDQVHDTYSGYDSSKEFDFGGMDEAQGVVTYYECEVERFNKEASRRMYMLKKAREARDRTKAQGRMGTPYPAGNCAGSVCGG